jgi:hypothetical protein
MKTIRFGLGSVMTIAFLLSLGLAANRAAAQVVLFEDEARPTMATGISGLDVGGTGYTVSFKSRTFSGVYGSYPGLFTFPNSDLALDVVRSIVAALGDSPATSIGEAGNPTTFGNFVIGYGSELGAPPGEVEQCLVAQGRRPAGTGIWEEFGVGSFEYGGDRRVIAVFELGVSAEQSSWGALKAQYEN